MSVPSGQQQCQARVVHILGGGGGNDELGSLCRYLELKPQQLFVGAGTLKFRKQDVCEVTCTHLVRARRLCAAVGRPAVRLCGAWLVCDH